MRHSERPRTLAAGFLPVLSTLILAVCATCALGQSPDRPGALPAFGTTSRILYHVGFADFTPEGDFIAYHTLFVNGHLGHYADGGGSFFANPHLPSGALLTYLEFDFCDSNSGSQHLTLDLSSCDYLGADCHSLGQIQTAFVPGDGCTFNLLDLTPQNFTLDNNARQLVLKATMTSGDARNVLLGAYIGYRLQVSPAPAVATFNDVPTTSSQFKFVEALVAAGITAGCGNGNYCPNNPVTRGQMAVFLATALGLHFPN